MLNWKVVTQSLASFWAISFVLCVGYGLLAPAAFHPSWLLEAILPGFKWLSVGSFVLGLVESALYGAWAGLLYSALYNYFARRAGHEGRASGHHHAGGVRWAAEVEPWSGCCSWWAPSGCCAFAAAAAWDAVTRTITRVAQIVTSNRVNRGRTRLANTRGTVAIVAAERLRQ